MGMPAITTALLIRLSYWPLIIRSISTTAGRSTCCEASWSTRKTRSFNRPNSRGRKRRSKVAQKRQDLYLAGAVQYWDWQVAVKQAEVVERTLAVAESAWSRSKGWPGGKVAPLDVVEANQEVQGGGRLRLPPSGRWSMSSINCPLFSGRTTSR